jgi:hypothetical protein
MQHRALVPEDLVRRNGARRRTAVTSLARACVAIALGGRQRAADTVTRWDDASAFAIVRGSVSPSDTSSASALGRQIMPLFFEALGPQSAAAELFGDGLQLSFDGAGAISLPALVADASKSGFVSEGAPIPVQQLYVENPALLHPKKLAVIVSLTREMAEGSNAVELFRDVLVRSTALALDVAVFGSNAASAAAPAGLRYGVSALTASSNADEHTALLDDVATLFRAVAPISVRSPIFVAAPDRAGMMQLRSPHGLEPLTTLGSAALQGTNDVIAVAGDALASATGSAPQVEQVKDTLLHMESATPLAIGTPGSPATVAAPATSLWQTDTIALKIKMPASWMLRDARGVAWLTAAKW